MSKVLKKHSVEMNANYIAFIILFSFIITILTVELNSYEKCNINDGETGECRQFKECPSAQQLLTKGQYPKICNYEKELVCCEKNVHAEPESNSLALELTDFSKILESTNCFAGSQFKNNDDDAVELLYETTSVGKVNRNVINFMAKIGIRSSNGDVQYFCGGVLLTPNFVLCPAHCNNYKGKNPEIVQLGNAVTDNTNNDDNFERIPISKIHLHPNSSNTLMYDNIALLELVVATTFTPACVWKWSEEAIQDENTKIFALGHDLKKNGNFQYMSVDLKATEYCNDFYMHIRTLPDGLNDQQYCAANSNITDANICKGFIGSPLLAQNAQKGFYVIGLANYLRQCYTAASPMIFTKILDYKTWIENIIYL